MSVTLNGTSGLVFGDGTTQGTAAGNSFRNRIINGDMRINQRGGSNILTTGGAANYAVDRFAVYPAIGSRLTINQASSGGPVEFSNYLRVTVTTAHTPTSTGQYHLLEQQVEGFNWADLEYGNSNAKTCTVSFWIRSSVTGTYSFGLRNSGLNRAYVSTYTINAANTWEYKTITIPGDTTGTWEKTNARGVCLDWDLGSSTDYLTSSLNQWIAAGTQQYASTTGVKLITNQGATWDITGVQVEKAAAATSFEHRPFGAELAMCQRYYYEYETQTQTGQNGGNISAGYSTYFGFTIPFKVSMRTSPTILQNLTVQTDSSGTITYGANSEGYGVNHGNMSGLYSYWAGRFKVSAEL